MRRRDIIYDSHDSFLTTRKSSFLAHLNLRGVFIPIRHISRIEHTGSCAGECQVAMRDDDNFLILNNSLDSL
jgi:hypothetical protein